MNNNILNRIWLFYYDGFRGMTLGKTLWIIIAIKLFILFFVFKLFFFRGELSSYSNDGERSRHVIENLTTSDKPKT